MIIIDTQQRYNNYIVLRPECFLIQNVNIRSKPYYSERMNLSQNVCKPRTPRKILSLFEYEFECLHTRLSDPTEITWRVATLEQMTT